jgi:hypothetical protein
MYHFISLIPGGVDLTKKGTFPQTPSVDNHGTKKMSQV